MIHRSEYQPAVDRNKEFLNSNPQLYRERAAIVEHPFGTMKRQWGFDYIITKQTMKRASADVGFMFIAYNFRRLINIIGKKGLTTFLKSIWLYTFNQTALIKPLNNVGSHLSSYSNKVKQHSKSHLSSLTNSYSPQSLIFRWSF